MAYGTEYAFYLFPAPLWADRARLRRRYPVRYWSAVSMFGWFALAIAACLIIEAIR